MTDPAKPTDAMDSPKCLAAVGTAIAEAVGDQGFELSPPQALYVALQAVDAMRALEPADSDGDGDAEWLQSMAHEIRKCGDALKPDFSIALTDGLERIANRIATRLEQHPGQGEWEALVKAAERATPTAREIVREDRDDGTERYIVKGVPCGFPVAKFGDRNDAELFIRAAALARADAPVGDANHD